MATDVINPKYTVFDLGYEKCLAKSDSFYDDQGANADKVTQSLPTILISGGGLAGNITVVDGFLQSQNYVAGLTGWKLTETTAYLPSIDLSGYLIATGGAYKTAASGARVEIFPDANTGIVVYDNDAAEVFKVMVGDGLGTIGDVTIGDYASNKGLQWDKSAATFTVKGAVVTGTGSTINGTYVDSLTVDKLASGTINSKAIVLGFTEGAGDCYIAAGKTDFDHDETGFIMGIDDSDSNKVKFIIGTPTEYLMVDGNTLVNTLKGATYTANIGGTTLLSTTTERQTTSTSAVKLKEINIGRNGNYKLLYELITYITNGKRMNWSIRKNGSEFSSGWSITDYSTTITIENLVVGDVISLYGWVESGADSHMSARYFNLKVDTHLEVYAPYYTTGYN